MRSLLPTGMCASSLSACSVLITLVCFSTEARGAEPERSSPIEVRDALRSGGMGPRMVPIEGGVLRTYSVSEGEACPRLGTSVTPTLVSAFLLGAHEVTFAEWDACAAAGACRQKDDSKGWGRGQQPVVQITREDALAYAEWLSKETGKSYRLPTATQWEYAARAGATTPYYFGESIRADQANVASRLGKPSPVGSYPPNRWGLYDMHGNVEEWVADTCTDPEFGRFRGIGKGGHYATFLPEFLHLSGSNNKEVDSNNYSDGFRVARALE